LDNFQNNFLSIRHVIQFLNKLQIAYIKPHNSDRPQNLRI